MSLAGSGGDGLMRPEWSAGRAAAGESPDSELWLCSMAETYSELWLSLCTAEGRPDLI